MTRAALLLSSLLATACTVGEISDNPGGGGSGGGTSDAGSGAVGNGCVDRLTPPASAHVHAAGGGTNAGLSCLAAGCHLANNPGAGAPGFQFAGTVYKTGAAKVANPGVIIRVKGSNGTTMDMYSDDAGNFSLAAGSLPMAFPATVVATACPTLTPMISTLVQGTGGDCSNAACHGGTTAPVTVADQ